MRRMLYTQRTQSTPTQLQHPCSMGRSAVRHSGVRLSASTHIREACKGCRKLLYTARID